MKQFEFEITASLTKKGVIQINAMSEEEAYEQLMDNIDSHQDDIQGFETTELEIEVDTFTVITEGD